MGGLPQPPCQPPPLTYPGPSQSCSSPPRRTVQSLLLYFVHKAPSAQDAFPPLLSHSSRPSLGDVSRCSLPSRSQPACPPCLRDPSSLPLTAGDAALRMLLGLSPCPHGGSGIGPACGGIGGCLLGDFGGGEKAVPHLHFSPEATGTCGCPLETRSQQVLWGNPGGRPCSGQDWLSSPQKPQRERRIPLATSLSFC